jgi:alkaline phosphatase D
VTAKNTAAGERTPEQQALLDPTLNPKFGYNLDAWDGYPIERELLLTSVFYQLLGTGRELVVLAGDTHNAWHADITTGGYFAAEVGGLAADIKVGTMLATSSVSSPVITYLVLAVSWWFWQVTRTMPGTRTLPPVAILQLKSVD